MRSSKKQRDRGTVGAYMIVALVMLFGIWVMGIPIAQIAHIKYTAKNCSVEVPAVIVNLASTDIVTTDAEGFDRVHTSYAPIVRFTTEDGREIEAKHTVYKDAGTCEVGESVTILYDPDDPYTFSMPDYDFKNSWGYLIFIAGGLGIFIVGIRLLIRLKKNEKLSAQLQQLYS